jgi:GNAT superfamily N-acetyltransferase
MMIEVAIREAEDADLPGILNVYRGAGLDSARTLSVGEAQAIFQRIRTYPDYKIFVTTCEGKIIGTFALLVMDNLVNGGLPSGIVEDVGLLKEYQGQGIGKQMMNFAFERCRQRGCYKLVLSSNEKRDAAHRFYESLGFVRHGFSFQVNLESHPSRGL